MSPLGVRKSLIQSDTVRYETNSRGCLNTLAREIFPLFFKVYKTSLAGVLKHPHERDPPSLCALV